MRTFKISKWFLSVLSAFIVGGMMFLTVPAQGATIAPCTLVVCLPVPTVTVTVPGRVTTLPRQTVVVRKIVPGPVTTRTIVRPGQISTVTVTQTAPTGQNVRPSAIVSTATVTTTVTAAPEVRTVTRDNLIEVSVPKAVGLSLGFVLLGAMATLLLLWLAYAKGYLSSEERNIEDLKSLRRQSKIEER